jgi:hypothetical protein
MLVVPKIVVLPVHAVLVEIVAAHRQEGAGPDVERDEGMW